MKKKFAALALSGAMAFSGLAGIVALGVSAEAGTDEKVIKAVTGGGDKGFVTETEWNTAYEHAMTGANTGSVKLATVGTNLYFRMIVTDTTKFTGKDRIAYKITVGGTTADIQGNYDPWLTGSYGFGPNVQTEMAYDDATTSYVVTIGMNLGDCYALGAAVDVAFTHQDVTTADGDWGSGEATTYSGKLYLGEVPEGGDSSGETSSDTASDSASSDSPSESSSESSSAEPVPAPENPDLKIVVTDLPSQPTESDWEKATAYDLIANNATETGATGTIKIYTAAENIFYRIEVDDPTTHTNADGLYIYLGTEDTYYESRGNYENWLADKHNDLGNPSLLEQKTTAAEPLKWTPGVYTFSQGFYLPTIYGEGKTVRLCVKHRDSRSSAETWADSDYTHTIYFDQIVTFGAPADTTIRPQTPTEGFTGTASDISYNKVNVNWNEFEGAETYKMYVYGVNPEGSEEAYTHLSIEGPIYSGDASYKELIAGLSEKTDYAVQIVAYDANDDAIAYSSLIDFCTISRQEAMESSSSSSGDIPDSSSSSSSESSSTVPVDSSSADSASSGTSVSSDGCGSALGIGAVSILAAAGVLAIGLKRRKK